MLHNKKEVRVLWCLLVDWVGLTQQETCQPRSTLSSSPSKCRSNFDRGLVDEEEEEEEEEDEGSRGDEAKLSTYEVGSSALFSTLRTALGD